MGLTIIGCGYLGEAVARQLQPRRPALPLTLTTTVTERHAELTDLADQLMLCDATDPAQLLAALQHKRTAVFCLAPRGNRQVNADGYRVTFVDSFRCLRSLLPDLPHLHQIIYTGSCSVYGDADGDWVDESTAPATGTEHGAVLLESERLITEMGDSKRQVCILRLAALYGPGRELDDRLKGLAGKERTGDGSFFSNWVHVHDAAGALIAAMDGAWSGVVNVVNDEPIRMRDLVDRSLKRQQLDAVHWSGGPAPVSGNGRRICNDRLKALGYRLQHPMLD
ncbi:NAD-dependent epimerase/dehydratase [Synechococcus sp. BIOS-E4-1]|uniref:NAD-dependent epimerase/dehydratase family protein n=1 Tax=Synechococcus sp. BIOS-E4-1 TaxID=1400864 RepID=UPI0016469C68|nr:NAD-dependent epimerase/dehydratase family protein [Synechococcus sp. BIOS-E4-1]QNI56268.1 NAD-dependent epimerase/dehydratase [Synechococcus sp. BIOS-E4-1]